MPTEQEIYDRYQKALNRKLTIAGSGVQAQNERSLLNQKGNIEASLAAQQHAAQAQRDAMQQLYAQQNANQHAGINADAAYQQHGYMTEREKQQQKDLLKRDATQFGYDTKRQQQTHQNQLNRDEVQFGYSQQQDAQQQQYTQQNMYQREAADISAKWQDQVAQAKNAGLEFSPKQDQKMKEMDAAFRENVLNGNLDEGQKQQAYVEHMKAKAAIIPEDKVQKPEDGLNQSVLYHEPTKTWFRVGRDSKGFPTYEPLGSSESGGQEKAAAAAQEKQQKQIRDSTFQREKEWNALINDIETRTAPGSDDPLYDKTKPEGRAKIEELAREEFAGLEDKYRRFDKLDPHDSYKREADAKRKEDLAKYNEQQKKVEQKLEQDRKKQEINLPFGPKSENPYQYKLDRLQQSPEAQQRALVAPPQARQQFQAGQKPLEFSAKIPWSPNVRQQLHEETGGDHLYKIREKHKSNSVTDQTVRMAADIVAKAILTKDTSDPDLAESQAILKKAGYQVGK